MNKPKIFLPSYMVVIDQKTKKVEDVWDRIIGRALRKAIAIAKRKQREQRKAKR